MEGPFSHATAAEGGGRWKPIAIGAAVIVILVGAMAWYGGKSRERNAPPAPSPYAANLQISDLKMSAAENFVGATVTYLEGKVTNTGDRTVTSAAAEVTFRNALNEVVQRDTVPLHVLIWQGPDRNVIDLRSAPLKPGQTADFRLPFEHISADWNRAYPELRIAQVSTQ